MWEVDHEREREENKWINGEQVRMLSALEAVGFTRFSINPNYGNIIAKADFNFGGVEVEVSYAERAGVRVTLGDDNCIWSDDSFDIVGHTPGLEAFARKVMIEWMREEFTEITDD